MPTDIPAPPPAAPTQHFYIVSKRKYVLLSLATLGIYQVYWIYKNWFYYKNATGARIWPTARGLFLIFFVHSLYRAVSERIRSTGRTYVWNASGLATAMVGTEILSRMVSKMSERNVGSPVTDVISLLTLPLLIAVTLPAQEAINFAENDPEGARNSKLTGINYFWLIIGIPLWILVAIGLVFAFLNPEGM